MLERIQNVLRNRKVEGDKGFSLVELAVVIVIIGILVAIAVPVFMSMQGSANKARNEANAANGASMIAAAIANSSGGSITKAAADAELAKLKHNGTAVAGATVSLPASGSVDLTNYCVQVVADGNTAKSGPACTTS